MKYYIGESGSTGREFDNIRDFLDAISNLASTHEETEDDWFEVEIVNG